MLAVQRPDVDDTDRRATQPRTHFHRVLRSFALRHGRLPVHDLAAELAPIGEGTAMGLFNAAAAAASALGAIAGGAVADRFGYESVNVFAAAGALLSLLCVLPLRNARRQVKNSQPRKTGRW